MRSILIIFLSLLLTTPIWANRFFQPQPNDLFIVDDFEDADLYINPKWWIFDNLNLSIKTNNQNEFQYLGKRSVQLTGSPKRWYVGGCGTYFGIDVESYNAIKLVVRGFGPDSGWLSIELFDDDNGNWEIEPHTDIESETLADDKFIHTLKVDWIGWKVIIIPFSKFVDGNSDIGDDKWNPYQKKGSGGLIQMQMVLLASNKKEKPRVHVDTIKIFNQ